MKPERPKTVCPSDVASSLLAFIRGQFYSGDDKRFFQDQSFLLRVIAYPAAWLTRRGVMWDAKKYESFLLGIFREIQQHGQTDQVKYWPGYLLHCVQTRFKLHGEEIYEEAKSARNLVEIAMLFTGKPQARPDTTTETLAQVSSILATKRKRAQKKANVERQLTLL